MPPWYKIISINKIVWNNAGIKFAMNRYHKWFIKQHSPYRKNAVSDIPKKGMLNSLEDFIFNVLIIWGIVSIVHKIPANKNNHQNVKFVS